MWKPWWSLQQDKLNMPLGIFLRNYRFDWSQNYRPMWKLQVWLNSNYINNHWIFIPLQIFRSPGSEIIDCHWRRPNIKLWKIFSKATVLFNSKLGWKVPWMILLFSFFSRSKIAATAWHVPAFLFLFPLTKCSGYLWVNKRLWTYYILPSRTTWV